MVVDRKLDLEAPYDLDQAARDRYAREGFVKLAGVLEPATLDHYRAAIAARVAPFQELAAPIANRSVYDQAFLQVMNLWERDERIAELVFAPKLARIAAQLIGADAVRLYHDQALFKEPGGGPTPWHCDQYYWPLDTERTVTAWIPLHDVPLAMGPLGFAAGTHRLDLGRGLPIGDESEREIARALASHDVAIEEAGFSAGEISFHAGWTLHRAGANETSRMREVMTIIYFADGARMAAPTNPGQHADWDRWLPGAEIGEVVCTPRNPVVYRRPRNDD